jgi:hypothetical protein
MGSGYPRPVLRNSWRRNGTSSGVVQGLMGEMKSNAEQSMSVPLWNRDRRESEVSLAKGKATLERLVELFLN